MIVSGREVARRTRGQAPAGDAGERAPAVLVRDAEVVRDGRAVWSGVSLSVERGDFAAVLGPNGAGKSTFLQALLGLLPVRAGEIAVLGRAAGRANAQVGYLPQRHSFDASTRIRGVDVVRLGLDGARWGLPFPGVRSRGDRERVGEVIELVGAGAYAERPIGQLSGGERQRLLIAQALVGRPGLLLLDEPLDGLDLPNQRAIAALLERISSREGVAVLLVAHDVNPIVSYLDRVIYFAAGAAVEGPPDEVITAGTLSRLYGVTIEVLRTTDGRPVVVGQPEAPHHHGGRHDE